ncbi:MAG: Thioredoxin-dependent 5'-adenylylsulfate reductase [bacterium ADurb.Bin429]|nr:MAG: Thioredoxin-dependent 5'-adenylylsulfate reductase [bacterium ADurb.Bin429]
MTLPVAELEQMTAPTRVAWAVREYGAGLTFACSFGAEDMVVLDLLLGADPAASVFLLDTGRLHQETYDLIQRTRERYGRVFTVYVPHTEALQSLLDADGPNGFYRSRDARLACCRVRKVEPLARALAGKAAWLTGLRREQAVTRGALPVIERDDTHGGIAKINPLADWRNEDVWTYIHDHDLPYNALHERDFPSIGCAPCTRAVQPGEDARAGRWWWEAPEHKECGLHLKG